MQSTAPTNNTSPGCLWRLFCCLCGTGEGETQQNISPTSDPLLAENIIKKTNSSPSPRSLDDRVAYPAFGLTNPYIPPHIF